MRILFTKELIFLILLLLTTNIFGQGAIQGVVTDSLSDDPLVGANIYLVGTGFGAAVNIEGQYSLTRIPFGNYTVKFSYIGYKAREFTININSNTTIELDVQLVPDVIEGEEVIISAQALGQAAAINQQLNSNTIINVVSEQKIQELPDVNAAETIGRLPGVSINREGGEANKVVMRGLSAKFSTVTINGVKISPTDRLERGVDLSTISQGSLAGIELFKALTPDKDADAIAGTINLVTKAAPSERLIRVDAKGVYNDLESSADQYNFAGRYGERFFDGILGVQLVGNLEKAIRSHENYEYSYDQTVNGFTDYIISNFEVRYQNEIRKRSGGSLLLDLNTPDNGTIKFNNVYSQTSRDYVIHRRNYPVRGSVDYNYQDIENEIKTFNSSLTGENYLFGLETTWGLSYSQSKSEDPFDWEMSWNEASSTNNQGEIIAGIRNIPPELQKGPTDAWVPYSLNNFQIAALGNAVDQKRDNFDKEHAGFIDLLRDYTMSEDITGEFKIGGKVKTKSRHASEYEVRDPYYLFEVGEWIKTEDGKLVRGKDFSGTIFDGLVSSRSVPLAPFLGSSIDSRDIYDLYAVNPLIVADNMRLWRDLNLNGYKSNNLNDPEFQYNFLINRDNYSLTERAYAGYLMNTLNFGRFATFIGGLRIEQDDNDYTGKYSLNTLGIPNVVASTGSLIDVNTGHTETNILPNFHAIIRPTDFLNVRLAAYRALAKPDFNRRLPTYVAVIASNKDLYIGNTDLKNAKAWNFEIQNQFYSNTIGLFSVNAFYKEIDDMFLTINGLQTSGTKVLDSLGIDWRRYVDDFSISSGNYNLHTQYNSDKPTKVWGFEIEHQANFRFLPGLLKNIILSYNFSIIRSETYIASEKTIEIPRPPLPPRKEIIIVEKKQKLEDQPEFFANAILGYDYEGFSFRISFFYQAEYNSSFSSDSRTDNVQNSFTRWDLSLRQKVTNNIAVYFNVNNITDSEDGRNYRNKIENRNLIRDANRYGRTADLGIRVEL